MIGFVATLLIGFVCGAGVTLMAFHRLGLDPLNRDRDVQVIQIGDEIHVVPDAEAQRHVLGCTCYCGPYVSVKTVSGQTTTTVQHGVCS